MFYKVIMTPFMTDTYIKKDYSRVDNVINEVVQIQKLASHLLPGLEYNQINMPIPITAHIPNIIINPIISPQNFKSNKCEDAGNQYA